MTLITIDEKLPFAQEQFKALEELQTKIDATCRPAEIRQTKKVKYEDSMWKKYLDFMGNEQ